MQPTKHLQQWEPEGRPRARNFSWLSAPGSSALSLLFLHGRDQPEVFGGKLDSITDTPKLVCLRNAEGSDIDQAMACRERNGILLTCHGGPAVRRALETELQRAGFREVEASPPGGNHFVRRTASLLPAARGAGAVGLVLDAAGQSDSLERLLRQPAAAAAMIEASAAARWLFEPPRVQLWGQVNAGKSSLLNSLCGQPLAAVGPEPGLTRDVLEGRLEHEGFELRLFDAPGTWAGVSEIDADAQSLAIHWRDQADLVLELTPSGAEPVTPNALLLRSRADEPGSEGVSIRRPETLLALKVRLVEHFFGKLRRLPPESRFALHPELRADLTALVEGSANPGQLRARWLD